MLLAHSAKMLTSYYLIDCSEQSRSEDSEGNIDKEGNRLVLLYSVL